MPLSASPACVGVDWGASRRRVYLLAPDGTHAACHEDAEGMAAARGRVAGSLDTLLGRLGIDWHLPVLVSGLAGTSHGAQPIPCLGPDVRLVDLPRHLVRLNGRRYALPGYAQARPHADLLRSQAAHLLGLVAGGHRAGWVVLPGAHSKWVQLRQGRMQRWHTFVTGELFEAQRHLGGAIPLLEAQWSDETCGFDAGLDLAARAKPLTQSLFSLRAAIVNGSVDPQLAAPMLSGLLIGTEFQSMARTEKRARRAVLVAADPLAGLYERAAGAFGWEVESLDAHAVYASGVRHLVRAAGC